MGRRGCPTPEKRGYPTYHGVARHQELLARRAAKRGDPQPTVYVCACKMWHVTSNKKRKDDGS